MANYSRPSQHGVGKTFNLNSNQLKGSLSNLTTSTTALFAAMWLVPTLLIFSKKHPN